MSGNVKHGHVASCGIMWHYVAFFASGSSTGGSAFRFVAVALSSCIDTACCCDHVIDVSTDPGKRCSQKSQNFAAYAPFWNQILFLLPLTSLFLWETFCLCCCLCQLLLARSLYSCPHDFSHVFYFFLVPCPMADLWSTSQQHLSPSLMLQGTLAFAHGFCAWLSQICLHLATPNTGSFWSSRSSRIWSLTELWKKPSAPWSVLEASSGSTLRRQCSKLYMFNFNFKLFFRSLSFFQFQFQLISLVERIQHSALFTLEFLAGLMKTCSTSVSLTFFVPRRAFRLVLAFFGLFLAIKTKETGSKNVESGMVSSCIVPEGINSIWFDFSWWRRCFWKLQAILAFVSRTHSRHRSVELLWKLLHVLGGTFSSLVSVSCEPVKGKSGMLVPFLVLSLWLKMLTAINKSSTSH